MSKKKLTDNDLFYGTAQTQKERKDFNSSIPEVPKSTPDSAEDYFYKNIYKDAKNNYIDMYDQMMADYQGVSQAVFAQQQQAQKTAENQFYNQLYHTNQTIMDSIRKNNAAAIASGASKGTQAAQELAAMLQGQQGSVDAVTELAQDSYNAAAEQQQASLEGAQRLGATASDYIANITNAASTAAQADAAKYNTGYEANLVQEQLAIMSDPNSSAAQRASAKALLSSLGVTPEITNAYVANAGTPVSADVKKGAVTTDIDRGSFQAAPTRKNENEVVVIRYGSESQRITMENDPKRIAKLNEFMQNNAEAKTRITEAPAGQAFLINDEVYVKAPDDKVYPVNWGAGHNKLINYLRKNNYYVFNSNNNKPKEKKVSNLTKFFRGDYDNNGPALS